MKVILKVGSLLFAAMSEREGFDVESQKEAGHVEFICGCTSSGKTEELNRRLRVAEYAHDCVQRFSYADVVEPVTAVVSTRGNRGFETILVSSSDHIRDSLYADTKVVGIDNVHLFDQLVVDLVDELANKGVRVVVAGLDMDHKGEPFINSTRILATAEFAQKLHAICTVCGDKATKSQLIEQNGSGLVYEARCREHHQKS